MSRRLIAVGSIMAGKKVMVTGLGLDAKADPHKVWPSTDNTPVGDYWRDSSYADELQMTMDRNFNDSVEKLSTFVAKSTVLGIMTHVGLSKRDLQLTVLHAMAKRDEP